MPPSALARRLRSRRDGTVSCAARSRSSSARLYRSHDRRARPVHGNVGANQATTPSTANRPAATYRTRRNGSRCAAALPIRTAGTSAISMPSGRSGDDGDEIVESRGEHDGRDLRLVAGFGEEECRRRSPRTRRTCSAAADSVSIAVGLERPQRHREKGRDQQPAQVFRRHALSRTHAPTTPANVWLTSVATRMPQMIGHGLAKSRGEHQARATASCRRFRRPRRRPAKRERLPLVDVGYDRGCSGQRAGRPSAGRARLGEDDATRRRKIVPRRRNPQPFSSPPNDLDAPMRTDSKPPMQRPIRCSQRLRAALLAIWRRRRMSIAAAGAHTARRGRARRRAHRVDARASR